MIVQPLPAGCQETLVNPVSSTFLFKASCLSRMVAALPSRSSRLIAGL